MLDYQTIVIGGGPAGLAASKKASSKGNKVLLVEREGKLGGILKQCIHDGFGLTRFKERLSGPEYAYKEIKALQDTSVEVSLLTFVTDLKKTEEGFEVSLVNPKGVKKVTCASLVLATGCRERTSKQVFIHGTNPGGVMTAGQCQYYMNILGVMPVQKAVILGSGDIGLIMARRITLEGGKVLGVYEAKPTPSGLSRNIAQCLTDFNIPLHLSTTVTRVFGVDRLEAVEIAKVDGKMNPIKGTEEIIECDSLILSVGLIPENELAKRLNVPLSPFTKGPEADQTFMTKVDGVFTCGNAMHVNDLADYVSESGEIAGASAGSYKKTERNLKSVRFSKDFGYVVPTMVDFSKDTSQCIFFFRSRDIVRNKNLIVRCNGEEVFSRFFSVLRPPEMERIVFSLKKEGELEFALEDKKA
jgi:thioredoxin reductase